jgi:hypothetical protein
MTEGKFEASSESRPRSAASAGMNRRNTTVGASRRACREPGSGTLRLFAALLRKVNAREAGCFPYRSTGSSANVRIQLAPGGFVATGSVLGSANRPDFDRVFALGNNSIGRFLDHLFQQHAQMSVRPVIGRCNVFHSIGVRV